MAFTILTREEAIRQAVRLVDKHGTRQFVIRKKGNYSRISENVPYGWKVFAVVHPANVEKYRRGEIR